jgi:alpha,alpha-trehalase
MTWVGLERYGYLEDAQRLSYRFLYMSVYTVTQILTELTVGNRMTTAFVDFNGVVPEKFDAVRLSHLVDAEYGNQGIDFKMVPREGFGWMNGTPDSGPPAASASSRPDHWIVSQPLTRSAFLSSRTTCAALLQHALRQRSSSDVR